MGKKRSWWLKIKQYALRASLRSWWQQIKRHRVAIGVGAIVLVVVIVLIIIGYWFDWTGFNGYNQVTITRTISGTNAGTVTKAEVYQPGKTLWDWLQLLIIPVVIAIGGFWVNQLQKNREAERSAEIEKENQRRSVKFEQDKQHRSAEIEKENQHYEEVRSVKFEKDKQREASLEAYRANMTELLLKKQGLRESDPDDEIRYTARVFLTVENITSHLKTLTEIPTTLQKSVNRNQ